MLPSPHERFAKRVLEWTKRRVGNEHTDTIAVYRAIHIPLAIALNHLFCPCSVVSLIPSEILERSHRPVVLPVDHVGRGIEQPILHLESLCVILVVGGIEIYGISMHIGCGVCRVFGLDNRHIEVLFLLCRCRHCGSKHNA